MSKARRFLVGAFSPRAIPSSATWTMRVTIPMTLHSKPMHCGRFLSAMESLELPKSFFPEITTTAMTPNRNLPFRAHAFSALIEMEKTPSGTVGNRLATLRLQMMELNERFSSISGALSVKALQRPLTMRTKPFWSQTVRET